MADPLSITAGIIAIGQACVAIGKGIRVLRSLGQAPTEFCDLLNQLSTLQALLDQTAATLKEASGPDEASVTPGIIKTRVVWDKLHKVVDEVNDLAALFLGTSKGVGKNGQHRISKVKWQAHKGRVERLRDLARESCVLLLASLGALSTAQNVAQTAMVFQLQQVVERSTDRLSSQAADSVNIVNGIGASISDLNGSVVGLHDHFHDMAVRLDTVGRGSQDQSNELQRISRALGSLETVQGQLLKILQSPSNTVEGTSVVCFQTSVRRRCPRVCGCRCHKITTLRSPHWLDALIGSCFLTYNGTPMTQKHGCDHPFCKGYLRSSFQIELYFPTWLLSRAMVLSASWRTMVGAGATLHLRFPRVISRSHDAWTAVDLEDIDWLRKAFYEKLVSPSDINDVGSSLILHSVRRSSTAMSSFLLQMGCDRYAADVNGMSAVKQAQLYLLRNYRMPQCDLFKHMTGEEDYLPGFTAIHDAILGLGSTTLLDALSKDPGNINTPDGFGYYPLHWTALRENLEATRLLLEWKADPNTQSLDGLTPLHFAVNANHPEIVVALLDAGSFVNAITFRGRSTLHAAVELTEDRGIIQILLGRGANPDIHNRTDRETAMNRMTRPYRISNPSGAPIGAARLLIGAGANLDIADFRGCTPILNASRHANGHVLFRLFHQGGARLDVADLAGRNVLHYAAAFGDMEHVVYLQSAALDDLIGLDRPDKSGETPWQAFQKRQNVNQAALPPGVQKPADGLALAFASLMQSVRNNTRGSEGSNEKTRKTGKVPVSGLFSASPTADEKMFATEKCDVSVLRDGSEDEEFFDALEGNS